MKTQIPINNDDSSWSATRYDAATTEPANSIRTLQQQLSSATRFGMSLPEYQAKIASGLKRCTKCKEWLPLSDYSNDASRGDGKSARCFVCIKVYVFAYREIPNVKARIKRNDAASAMRRRARANRDK